MSLPVAFDMGPRVETGEHYALLRHVLEGVKGTALEFGVGRGESTAIIAEHLPVVGFDSWLGLPSNWRPGFPKGSFAFMPPDIEGVELVEGWFEDTLPDFDFEALGHIGIVHLDADLYESTAIALECCGPALVAGTVLVFDEFHSYPEASEHEQKAFAEFLDYTGFDYQVLGHGHEAWSCRLA